MHIIVLNSGSNGNAVYVESADSGDAVLLDCGISRRRIESRLKVHGRFLDRIRAVFITHEHADHVRGLAMLQKAIHVPAFFTQDTYRGVWKRDALHEKSFIHNRETVQVGDLTIESFPKSHDAKDPVFFLVTRGSKRFLYITDLGIPNQFVHSLLPEVDGLFLESNYDREMLLTGDYPQHLKERIADEQGHLSNTQAISLIEEHCNGKLRVLILGHLSENNNAPEIVAREVSALLDRKKNFEPRIHIASRYTVSDVITL